MRTKSQRLSARLLLLQLLLLPGLSGCGYLFGDNGYFRDSSLDYKEASEQDLIELPPGRRSDSIDEIYAIPAVGSELAAVDRGGVPRPAPLVAANADQLVRIQRLGDDSWALVAIAPGQLWPQLRSFLSAANVSIQRMDARSGIIESDYVELQEQEQRSRFRFRVERGVQRGNSELHVLQMYESSGDSWSAQSDDLELESDMLRGISQFIANSADTAPVSMMAEQSISATGKVSLQESDSGSYIRLELPFDRAWASLARALDLSGFTINDRNRSEGLYYLEFVGEETEEKSGWFGWMSGGKDEQPAAGVPLLLSMVAETPDDMIIRLAVQDSAASLAAEELQALLVLIKGNIN
ncbi:MAG: outer membrane protein assembly factor BamC [Halieaceae bacterium]|jgi:outer membrane protein assembly factor BamC